MEDIRKWGLNSGRNPAKTLLSRRLCIRILQPFTCGLTPSNAITFYHRMFEIFLCFLWVAGLVRFLNLNSSKDLLSVPLLTGPANAACSLEIRKSGSNRLGELCSFLVARTGGVRVGDYAGFYFRVSRATCTNRGPASLESQKALKPLKNGNFQHKSKAPKTHSLHKPITLNPTQVAAQMVYHHGNFIGTFSCWVQSLVKMPQQSNSIAVIDAGPFSWQVRVTRMRLHFGK